jgi:hypothetical protein
MSMLDDLRSDVVAAQVAFKATEREWRKLCRKHGGAKKTFLLAWGRDEELAVRIRAVRLPYLTAKANYKVAVRRFRAAALLGAVESCLAAMEGKEAAHAG